MSFCLLTTIMWWSVQVGDVILQKSSLGGTLVYGGAIIMSFIGVGFSMFSLSRLQNSSERRALITEVLKWSTPIYFCLYVHIRRKLSERLHLFFKCSVLHLVFLSPEYFSCFICVRGTTVSMHDALFSVTDSPGRPGLNVNIYQTA